MKSWDVLELQERLRHRSSHKDDLVWSGVDYLTNDFVDNQYFRVLGLFGALKDESKVCDLMADNLESNVLQRRLAVEEDLFHIDFPPFTSSPSNFNIESVSTSRRGFESR